MTAESVGCVCCAVVLLAFSLPKIYELKKHEIDSGLSQAQSQAQKIHSQVQHPPPPPPPPPRARGCT